MIGAGDHQQLRRRAGDHAGDGLGEEAAHLGIERHAQRRRRRRRRRRSTSIEAAAARRCRRSTARISAAMAGVLPPQQQHGHDRDQRDVEQQRRERGQREAALRVEQRHQHGHGAGEGEIRQHQPRIVDRSRSVACPAKPGASTAMTSGISKAEQRASPRSAPRSVPSTRPAKAAAAAAPSVSRTPQPGRHQRRVQRALGEQPPGHIDELKRDQKRIRDRARAEQRGDQASRMKPSSREASVPEDTVRKERIIGHSIAAASLAGARADVIGRSLCAHCRKRDPD